MRVWIVKAGSENAGEILRVERVTNDGYRVVVETENGYRTYTLGTEAQVVGK
jgi:hypothetical protein